MAALTLKDVLEKTVSPNQADQQTALEFLKQAYESNYVEFVKLLSEFLRTLDVASIVRQSAGLSLKNSLTAKEEPLKQERSQKWMSCPTEIRTYVKMNIMETLGTEDFKPSQAAQCVACVACIELPRNEWKDSIQKLMTNVTTPGSTEGIKEASLEALGYICQDIQSVAVLSEQSNAILTAIVNGMKKDEPSERVRLAATTALYNSLEFTAANFANEGERHLIMQVVCETTQVTNTKLKVAALQCLVRIMSLYYAYMEHYMGPALFAITLDAMRSEDEDVALQGIEFWSNVCEEELDLAVEAEEAVQEGRPPVHTSKFYAKGALPHLVPILTAALTKQEGDDEDDWNPSKAAGVSLMLLAQTVGDDVVLAVLPFVTQNINHQDWRYRDAAVMAFGSVLEGPDPEKLKTLVQQALPMLINLLTDGHTVVRDTAAWCIGRVCEICPSVIIQPEVLQPLLPALSTTLQQEPRVAANVCWAISSLALAAYEQAAENETDESGTPETFILSSCFDAMVAELLKVTERQDASQSNLRIAAYEALMELIKNSPRDCYPTVQKTLLIILEKIKQLFAIESQLQSSSEKSQFRDLQSLLCASLQSVIRKMSKADATMIAAPIMEALTHIMSQSAGADQGGVQEEAIMAVATLVEVLHEGFKSFLPEFKPYLMAGLKNHEEYQVCLASVGLVGDICRATDAETLLQYTSEIMEQFVFILEDQKMDKSVMPQVISTFGDIALSLGHHFSHYAEVVMGLLVRASQYELTDKEDYDQIEYFNQVRESCLEAYTGVIQGFRTGVPEQEQQLFQMMTPHAANMVIFLEKVANEQQISENLVANSSGLIGDLVTAYGKDILSRLETEAIEKLLAKGRRAKTQKARTLATWATKEIRKLKNAGS